MNIVLSGPALCLHCASYGSTEPRVAMTELGNCGAWHEIHCTASTSEGDKGLPDCIKTYCGLKSTSESQELITLITYHRGSAHPSPQLQSMNSAPTNILELLLCFLPSSGIEANVQFWRMPIDKVPPDQILFGLNGISMNNSALT